LQEKKAPVVKMSQDDMDADLDSYIKGRAAGEEPADAAVPATEWDQPSTQGGQTFLSRLAVPRPFGARSRPRKLQAAFRTQFLDFKRVQ
jgi:hypothetical protein